MKCQRSGRSATSAAFPRSSWARFSPKSRWPSAASARTASAGQVLLTASSDTSAGSRPAARAVASIRARTARRFAARSFTRRSSQPATSLIIGEWLRDTAAGTRSRPTMINSARASGEPDQAGLPAGDAVAAVGEQGAVLGGAPRVLDDLGDAGPPQALGDAGPQVQAWGAGPGPDGGRGRDTGHVALHLLGHL